MRQWFYFRGCGEKVSMRVFMGEMGQAAVQFPREEERRGPNEKPLHDLGDSAGLYPARKWRAILSVWIELYTLISPEPSTKILTNFQSGISIRCPVSVTHRNLDFHKQQTRTFTSIVMPLQEIVINTNEQKPLLLLPILFSQGISFPSHHH